MIQDNLNFYDRILSTRKEIHGNPEYGAVVMPAIRLYKSLRTFEERRAFQDALEQMLQASDQEVRKFAVDVCLGFFVFRNAT